MTAETVEQFLYRSLRLLDAGAFDAWLETCTEDVALIVKTRADAEAGSPVAIINDDADRLRGRIEQIKRYWHAERPPTRTFHSLTNIEVEPGAEDRAVVHCCFTVVATRRGRQDVLYGRYRDTLRRVAGEWRLERREALLESDLVESGKISYIV